VYILTVEGDMVDSRIARCGLSCSTVSPLTFEFLAWRMQANAAERLLTLRRDSYLKFSHMSHHLNKSIKK